MRLLAAVLLSLLSTAVTASDLQPTGTAAAERAMVMDAAPLGAAMSGDALQCGVPIVIDNAAAASAIEAKAQGDTDAHAERLGDLPAAARQSIAGLAATFTLDEGLIGRAYFAGLCQRLAEKGVGPGDAKPALTAVAEALGLSYPPSEAAATETPPAEAKPEAPVVAETQPEAPVAPAPAAPQAPAAEAQPEAPAAAAPTAPEPPQVAAVPEAASPAPESAAPPAADAAPAAPPAPTEAAPAQPETGESRQIAAAEPPAAAAPPPAATEPQPAPADAAPAQPAPTEAAPAQPGPGEDRSVASSEPPAAPAPAPAPSAAAPESPPHIAEAPAQPALPSEPEAASPPAPAPAAPPAEQHSATAEAPAPAAPPAPASVGAEPPAPVPAAPEPQTPVVRSAAPGAVPGTLGEAECRALGVLGHCPDLNAVLDRLLEKPLEYNHPKTMLLGRKTEIGLVLRTDWEGKDLPTEVSEELKGLPGEVKQGLSKVTRVMSAELTGRDFEISPAARQERTVVPPQPVNWAWQVSPTDTGSDKTLKLRLYAHIQGPDGTMPPLLVKTLDANIAVDVTTWDWLVIQARTLEPVYAIGAALLGLLTAILTYVLARRRDAAPVASYPESGGYFDPSTRYSGPVIGDLGQSATDSRSPAPKAAEAPPAPAPEAPPAAADPVPPAAATENGSEPKKD